MTRLSRAKSLKSRNQVIQLFLRLAALNNKEPKLTGSTFSNDKLNQSSVTADQSQLTNPKKSLMEIEV